MDIQQVFAAADRVSDHGSPEWLRAMFIALTQECHGDQVALEDIDLLVRMLVRQYCRRSTVVSFAKLVKSMRTSQHEYFRTKMSAWLERAKSEERQVDQWVESALAPVDRQRPLFPNPPAKEPYR